MKRFEIEFETKKAKLGSSIKNFNSKGKEEFLTVELVKGDICLFKGITKKAKLSIKDYNNIQYFTYNNKNYILQ